MALLNGINERIHPGSDQYDDAMFCSVLYQLRFGVAHGSTGDWLPQGNIGEKFKSMILIPGKPDKKRYRNARDQAIDKGLVQMGWRKLNDQSTEREIMVVPRSSPPTACSSLWPNGNLSIDSLLRLTKKGISLAEESLAHKVSNVESKTPDDMKPSERNIHLSNLPITGHPAHYHEQKSHGESNGAMQTATIWSMVLSNEITGHIRPAYEQSDDAMFCSVL
jgi:hypothetical protein